MSLQLQGRNGNEFELGLVRESYADVQDSTGDAAWATLSFRVATPDLSWEEEAPCMNLYELDTLVEWLDAVGRGPGGSPELGTIDLLEPELSFAVSHESADSVTIRIGFHLENRPEEFEVDSPTDMKYIDLDVTRSSVRVAATRLRDALVEMERANLKDDVRGEMDPGAMGIPDEDLNIVDGSSITPPGAGEGEDNAGET